MDTTDMIDEYCKIKEKETGMEHHYKIKIFDENGRSGEAKTLDYIRSKVLADGGLR